MKKATSAGKTMQKGKSMSSIHQNHQSRLTNKSIDTRKVDSKVSKISKTNSIIKVHQPLTIQHRDTLKQSKLQNSKLQPVIVQGQNSRRKIHSQLQNKKSYDNTNPISFRQTQQTKTVSIIKPKQSQTNQLNSNRQSHHNTNKIREQNQKLCRENKQLKDKVFRLQSSSIQDKEKIKTLITRISQIKRDTKLTQNSMASGIMSKSKTTASYAHIMKTRGLTERDNVQSSNYHNQAEQTPFRILHHPSASQSKYSKTKQTCPNPQCEERKKYLQGELYKERIKRDQLQEEKKDWQRNKDQLKRQYQDLLYQIQNLREQSVCQQEQQ